MIRNPGAQETAGAAGESVLLPGWSDRCRHPGRRTPPGAAPPGALPPLPRGHRPIGGQGGQTARPPASHQPAPGLAQAAGDS